MECVNNVDQIGMDVNASVKDIADKPIVEPMVCVHLVMLVGTARIVYRSALSIVCKAIVSEWMENVIAVKVDFSEISVILHVLNIVLIQNACKIKGFASMVVDPGNLEISATRRVLYIVTYKVVQAVGIVMDVNSDGLVSTANVEVSVRKQEDVRKMAGVMNVNLAILETTVTRHVRRTVKVVVIEMTGPVWNVALVFMVKHAKKIARQIVTMAFVISLTERAPNVTWGGMVQSVSVQDCVAHKNAILMVYATHVRMDIMEITVPTIVWQHVPGRGVNVNQDTV